MTSFYNRHIMPRLVDAACGSSMIAEQRQKIVPQASGVVVEVGIGPGHNLAFYDRDRVKIVFGIDPIDEMTALAKSRIATSPVEIEMISAPGENLPLEDNLADTIMLTYSACTIPNVDKALLEMRRVLKPSGRLLFAEHGRSPQPHIARWQDRLDGIWGKLAGGCHINRDIAGLIEQAGFTINDLETGYLVNLVKISSYHFRGMARLR